MAIGDALGVPVELMKWEDIRKNPVQDMLGNGTHLQAPATFSVDGSLAFHCEKQVE
ncbi:ADP-ribosylglycohydrolase family protein [Aquirufa beregesia]|uniref:ADP-ribosylglycohydrolase family protein n=1 Tax=Aquirufa beregesia TaxID=2516556 RepID=UPI00197AB16C|nr:ADP-ribosylglycohydrolase family protein [Aquirufa beregesia]